MSPWQEYKAKLGTTRPWDMLNPNTPKAEESEANNRYSICLECDKLLSATKQCKECGCFMVLKVKLKDAVCPLAKW